MLYTSGFESDCGAKADRAGAEDHHLVRWFRRNLVHPMSRNSHRLVQCGHFERDVIGHDLEACAAHRLLDYMSYGGDFHLANFNNMCNTWGQNVIEASKDTCFLSCAGQVFSFFRRNFSPCVACETETGDERVYAQQVRCEDGKTRLYLINHASAEQQVKLPQGEWRCAEGITAPNRMSRAKELENPVIACTARISDGTVALPGLSLVCLECLEH